MFNPCSSSSSFTKCDDDVTLIIFLKKHLLRLALAALNLKKCEVIKTVGDTNNFCVKTTLNEIDNNITQFLRIMKIQRVASFDSVRFQWKAIEDSDMVWHADHSALSWRNSCMKSACAVSNPLAFIPSLFTLYASISHTREELDHLEMIWKDFIPTDNASQSRMGYLEI